MTPFLAGFVWHLDGIDCWSWTDVHPCRNRVHVCPSSREGFGHYINEARSVSAVIITVDAPPMNEFVTNATSGILIPALGLRQIGNNMFDMLQVVCHRKFLITSISQNLSRMTQMLLRSQPTNRPSLLPNLARPLLQF